MAIDVTPLLGARTGIGAAVAEIVGALRAFGRVEPAGAWGRIDLREGLRRAVDTGEDALGAGDELCSGDEIGSE